MAARSGISVFFASVYLVCCSAAASGLQVSPVSLTLLSSQNAEGLWLSNTGENVVHAQVRIYRWTQEAGEDKLMPSSGLVVSPPMVQLAAGARQLIRAIRLGPPATGTGAAQDAYRMIIDELPVDSAGKKGLTFVLRYSVPVFLEPAGGRAAPPQLSWALVHDSGKVALEVLNSGGSSAQLAQMTFVDKAGGRTELTPGLLGYVLPGSKMRWALKPAAAIFNGGGTIETMINGQTVQQEVSLGDTPR